MSAGAEQLKLPAIMFTDRVGYPDASGAQRNSGDRRDGAAVRGFHLKSLFENYEGCCGEGFWLWPRRRGPSIPAAGCKERANAGHRQKTRRPEGFRGKGRLASLLLSRRSARDILLRRLPAGRQAPRHPAFSQKTAPLVVFKQALSKAVLRIHDVEMSRTGFRGCRFGLAAVGAGRKM